MPSVKLTGRSIVRVTGEDAEKLLQGVITTDLDALPAGDLKPGALLAPQGKILFEFLVSRCENGIRLDTLAGSAADLAKRLTLYRLRAKAEIIVENESLVVVSWDSDSSPSDIDSTDSIVLDKRFPEERRVVRLYDLPVAATDSEAEWMRLRIAYGIAEAPHDYALGDAFPHDINFDQIEGVSFKKGCFIGQEVVSRMQHRGTARRRLLIVSASETLPASGTSITANGKDVGTLGSVNGPAGLALARIDRVKDAMDAGTPLMAGEIAVQLTIPQGSRFAFPEAAGSDA